MNFGIDAIWPWRKYNYKDELLKSMISGQRNIYVNFEEEQGQEIQEVQNENFAALAYKAVAEKIFDAKTHIWEERIQGERFVHLDVVMNSEKEFAHDEKISIINKIHDSIEESNPDYLGQIIIDVTHNGYRP